MHTAKRSGLLEAALHTRSSAPSAGYLTEMNCPGPLVPLCGVVSSPPGGELAAGLLLIFLFVAALVTPFEEWMPQERDGKESSQSSTNDSPQTRRSGGTERGPYDRL